MRVTPRSSRNDVRIVDDAVKVWVTASPTDGQANDAVIALLAKRLGVAPSRLTLTAGQAGREKTIQVEGLTLPEAMAKFA